jgi:hypothetical protein
MAGRGAQLSICEIAVGTFGEATMAVNRRGVPTPIGDLTY